jgi:hypothetical protein
MISDDAFLRIRRHPPVLVFGKHNSRIQTIEFFWLSITSFLRITKETDRRLSTSKIDYIVIYIDIYLI